MAIETAQWKFSTRQHEASAAVRGEWGEEATNVKAVNVVVAVAKGRMQHATNAANDKLNSC